MKLFYLTTAMLITIFFGCKSSTIIAPLPNGTTKGVNYSVPVKSIVKLTIENNYNTIIETPVNKEQNPGQYRINIDVSNFVEGVYFYTLEIKSIDNTYNAKATYAFLLVR